LKLCNILILIDIKGWIVDASYLKLQANLQSICRRVVEEASGKLGGVTERHCASMLQFRQLVGVSEEMQEAGRDNLFNLVHVSMLDLFLSSLDGLYNQPILLQTYSLYKTTNVMNVYGPCRNPILLSSSSSFFLHVCPFSNYGFL
jgi:hypothetical protein